MWIVGSPRSRTAVATFAVLAAFTVLATLTALFAPSRAAAREAGREGAHGAARDTARDDWPMFRAAPDHPGAVDTRGVERLSGIRWTVRTEGPIRSSASVVGDTVYFGSDDGGLYAVHAADGRVLWRHEAGAPVRSTPAVAGRLVHATAGDRRLIAVDRFDGALRWEVVGGPVIPFEWGLEGWDYFTSSPTPADGRIVVGFGDGTVRALDPATGDEVWRHPTGGRIRATPAVSGGAVFVGSADGHLHALDLGTGRPLWTFATEGVELRAEDFGFDRRTIQGSATVVGETVYFGSRDAHLYAVDRRTGEERWRSNDGTSAWVVATPAVVDGVVYSVRSSSARFRALDAETGELLYERSFGGPLFGSPVVAGDAVYATTEGEVVALDPSEGEILWRHVPGGAIWTSPVVVGGVLYVGTDDGELHALEDTRGPDPRLAVYWEESLRDRSVVGRLDAHREPVEYFVERGYEELDGAGLAVFLGERLRDRAPSAVVMAMDALPTAVADGAEPSGLLIRYLEAGGKVVWTGRPPFYLIRDPEASTVDVDRGRATRFTGVDHSDFNLDAHAHRATAAGRRWGMEGWWMGPRGVDPRTVTAVLATDDTGRAAAWVKSFGGPAGTGFVSVPPSTRPERLEQIRRVTEHGIFRRP